jgi:hypothetical protein
MLSFHPSEFPALFFISDADSKWLGSFVPEFFNAGERASSAYRRPGAGYIRTIWMTAAG